MSQIVVQLEKRLGVRLVDRSCRPLQLTREGQVYYDGCRQLVEKYQSVEAAVRSLNVELGSDVRVAAIYSVGLRDMSQVVERFRAQNPGVEVGIDYLHPDKVYERVLDGTADLGLVSFPQPTRKIAAIPWRDEEMVLACSRTHAFASRRSIRPEELDGEKYVGFDKDLLVRRRIDRFLRSKGVTVDMALEFDNIENIKQAIEISAGVALLPLPVFRREVDAGVLAAVPLEGTRFVRPLGIIHRRSPAPGRAALRLIEQLRQPDDTPSADGAPGALSLKGVR